MARKSLQDLSGIANTIARSGPAAKEPARRSSAPALGALQGSLSAIRELDPDKIDDWGPGDRMDSFTAVNSSEDVPDGFDALKESIAADGQQVPILVRKTEDGRYQAIYGRRRLRACRELGIKVRANVQDVDDATALLAKGLENAVRRGLSFYERARFAEAIEEAGHGKDVARKVLGLSPASLSHLTKITALVPAEVGDRIGVAAKSGRPKWTALATAFEKNKVDGKACIAFLDTLPDDRSSDERLELLLKYISFRGARGRDAAQVSPVEGVTIRSTRTSIAVSVKREGANAAFAEWLDERIGDLIKDSYEEFTAVNTRKNNN
ncbi:MAG: plasmid partitioning protein RepB [Pseudooceanicola nanhaiensis]|uniref:plasmid partitioning protein RepB n=1 Tax=Rhodobacterales TaxID=204455 RepID=UPI0040597CA0